MGHRPAIPLVAVYVLGVMCAERLSTDAHHWLMVAGALAILSSVAVWQLPGRRISTAILLLAVTAGAGAWHSCRQETVGTITRFCSIEGTIVLVRGVVREAPVAKPRQASPLLSGTSTRSTAYPAIARYGLDARAIRCGATWVPASGILKCTVKDPGLALDEGHVVEVLGLLRRIRPPTNPGQFDYACHAKRHGTAACLRSSVAQNINVIGRDTSNPLRLPFAWLRSRVTWILRGSLAQEPFAVCASMLLGRRAHLPDELGEAFRRTGTVHFLAISGLHTGLMAGSLWFALSLCGVPQRGRASVVIPFLLAYGQLVGWRPSVTRSVVMMGVLFSAPLMLRVWDRASGVAVGALAVLVLNPADLFNPGFQLSVAGVLGIVLISPRIQSILFGDSTHIDRLQAADERSLWRRALPRNFGHVFFASMGAWLATLPLVAYHFHLFAPFQIVFNLVAGLLVWVLLAFGMLLVVTAGLAGPATLPFVGWASRTLIATVWVCHRMPGCYHYVVGPSTAWIVLYYALLVLWLAHPWFGIRCKHLLLATVLAANAYVFSGQRRPTADATHVTFLDVGHGLSVLVTLPEGRTLLYDVGASGYPNVGKDIVAPALWARGLRRIDAVVLSHADADHFNGFTSLAERVELGSIVTTERFVRSRFGRRLTEYAEHNRIPLLVAASGAEIQVSTSVTLDVLHPPQAAAAGLRLSSNDSSLVLRVESSGRSILLTGDAETAAWSTMRSAAQTSRADVVSLPHHGSHFPGYGDFVAPHTGAIAVVSCRGELPARTAAACANADVRVISTAATGAVRIILTPHQTRVETFDRSRWRPLRVQ